MFCPYTNWPLDFTIFLIFLSLSFQEKHMKMKQTQPLASSRGRFTSDLQSGEALSTGALYTGLAKKSI